MSRYFVVVTDDRFGSYEFERDILSQIDADLYVTSRADSDAGAHALREGAESPLAAMSDEAADAWSRADGMLVNLFPMSAGCIRALSRCRVLSRYGTGYDNVDVEAARAGGMVVTRVPDYATEEASDHAIAMMLAAARRLPERDKAVREAAWDRNRSRVRRIRGSRLGVIGLGRAGRAVIRKMRAFEPAEILVFDPHKTAAQVEELGARQVDLATLMQSCDFVSLHAPLRDETRGMITREILEHAHEGMVFVNTARGPIVDQAALTECVASGRIAYAGLDVFEEEPLPASAPLCELGNVILSDHSAYYSEESIVDLKRGAAENLAAVLRGDRLVNAV